MSSAPQKFLKSSWPEVVGWPATQAVMKITKERSDVFVEVLRPGSSVTPGYNPARVNVFIDNKGLVDSMPFVA